MTFDTPGTDPGEEGAEGTRLDPSTENECKLMEKVSNLTINAEVLKSAIEQVSATQARHSVDFQDWVIRFMM
jgi:hypothetical protein